VVQGEPEYWAELNRKCMNRTQHARTARMVYRRACFKMCGGIELMNFLLAVGDINDLLISCAKQASTELVEARKRKLGDAYREPEVWQPQLQFSAGGLCFKCGASSVQCSGAQCGEVQRNESEWAPPRQYDCEGARGL
jgi:hypothetical protein